MFKFGFSGTESNQDNDDNGDKNSELNWFPAVEINVTEEQIARDYDHEDEDDFMMNKICGMNIKLFRLENIVLKLKDNEHENIIKAESQHSDLLPAVYEGGLKVWECSYDLGEYILSQDIPLKNLRVLDLGCGAGILGIIALLRGAVVHFQDYNQEVIEMFTIPNVLLNSTDRKLIKQKAEFYAGDWAEFIQLSANKYPNEDEKYDIIFTCETIYNSDNQKKLYQVFKERLKNNGVGYVAGKTYYFGVGGGMRQFESLIKDDNTFNVENVWTSDQGLQREIMKLTRQPN
ncbi:hypothetical protein PV328_004568 [Microctonus aethiopoides]|uniref:protein-histidine N-methyltransferase n=1 Tax=Microctonus aethiopoides TaxID=144406 RepID=A0AA39KLV8_9HYME|nr:hypothetical protein PV328_004568 [Microctonus aethiopoides]